LKLHCPTNPCIRDRFYIIKKLSTKFRSYYRKDILGPIVLFVKSPIVPMLKKDGMSNAYISYHILNKIIANNHYSILHIEDLIVLLGKTILHQF
jgi:hypothetical protein